MNHATLLYKLLLILLLTVPPMAAVAQGEEPNTDATMPEALSPESMSALVSKLDAEQTAALTSLIELLSSSVDGAAVPESPPPASMMATVGQWISGFGIAIVGYARDLPEMLIGIGEAVWRTFADAGGSALFPGVILLVIAAGIAAEWIFNRLCGGWRSAIKASRPDTLLATLKVLSTRALLQIGGLVAFAVAALVAVPFFYTDPGDRNLASSLVLQAILIPRVCAALLRFVLAPTRSDLRLVSTNDETARYLYRQLVIIATIVGVALFLVTAMQHFGIDVVAAYRFWVGLILTSWILYVTWRARSGLTEIIRGEDEELTPGLEKMAAWWPVFSMVVIALDWVSIQIALAAGDQTVTAGRSALSGALIIVAPFLDTMVRGIAAHLVPAMQGEGAVAEKAQQQTRMCYVRMGRVILFAVLIVLIAKLRGISFYSLTETGLGPQIAANGFGFILILALGYLAWEVTNLWINRRLAKELPADTGDSEGGEAGGAGLSRMATILPILRMTLQAAIITITALLALSQLGVNITPLLAGAGVLGLAIGFGAQTLVKDVVSGVFFLLDDAFRVGEYIDVGGTEGTVEKISVRSLQLRGATGPVHIVPYGSISKLTNMSRDWVIMKLKFTVPFDTDLEKVRKIFKKIGQQIAEVPEYAEDLISPFKSQGAADVTDVGIVVRGKFTTKPGGQWGIRKEIYSRVQKAFEENGIEFARKEVWVQMPDQDDDKPLTDVQKQAISAAASQGAEPTR